MQNRKKDRKNFILGREDSSILSLSEGEDFLTKMNDPLFCRKNRDFTVMLKNKPVEKRST